MYLLCVLCRHHKNSHCIGTVTARVAVFTFQGLALSADADGTTQKLKAQPRADKTLFMLPLIWGGEPTYCSDRERNFHVMVYIHVNRFRCWWLSPWASGRCCLQVFWSGEEKWMVGRKERKGQSHWIVSSATELEELRNLPSDPAKETENTTVVHFHVDKFLKQKLETANCWIHHQTTVSWVLTPSWHGL